MATVTKAQTLNTNKALIRCIAGGKNCDAEMARQPVPVRAIKTEMTNPKFIVRVQLIEIHEFSERYPDIRSKTSKSTKENDEPKGGKGGKNPQDGKGKDHQSSPPSRLLCKRRGEDLIMTSNQSRHNPRGGGAPPWPLSQTKEVKGGN